MGLWCCIHDFDVEKYYEDGTQAAGRIKRILQEVISQPAMFVYQKVQGM